MIHNCLVRTGVALLAAVVSSLALGAAEVRLERIPEGGIQPQVTAGADGTVHLLFFKGDPKGGNVFYTSKRPGQKEFAAAIQVNSQPGGAIAIGTMRGPQLALGKAGRVHVSWMGGAGAQKAKIGNKEVTGMFYARMENGGQSFERERNLITYAAHLDGGGTVAADQKGNVYVLWHGSTLDQEGEENRAVYLARSTDEGATFSREEKATTEKTGSCACCGMRAYADDNGALYVLFRAALSPTDRPELLLVSTDKGKTFKVTSSSPWEVSTCPASTAAMWGDARQRLASWESEGKVYWSKISENGKEGPIPVGGHGKQRHPHLASNKQGEVLVVWAEGTGWEKGGAVGWRLFDGSGKATGNAQKKDGVPLWSFAAAYPERDGNFVILY